MTRPLTWLIWTMVRPTVLGGEQIVFGRAEMTQPDHMQVFTRHGKSERIDLRRGDPTAAAKRLLAELAIASYSLSPAPLKGTHDKHD